MKYKMGSFMGYLTFFLNLFPAIAVNFKLKNIVLKKLAISFHKHKKAFPPWKFILAFVISHHLNRIFLLKYSK